MQKLRVRQYHARRRDPTRVFYAVTLAFVCSLNCVTYTKYVPNPETDIDLWIKDFEQQMSLSYDYEMSVGTVKVQASGNCVIGEGEMLEGKWKRDGAERDFQYVGLGDIEYTRSGAEWDKSSRGEQSDVFTQIKRTLTFDKFEYTGFDEGFWYRFTANVPFLAPEHRKEMVGLVKISDKNYLPEYIWAGLPDSSVYWTSRISDYNTVKRIEAPVREYVFYSVGLGAQSVGDEYKRIDKRFDLVKVEHRLSMTSKGIELRLPVQYGLEDVEKMLKPGRLVVYSVVQEGKEASRISYLKDDLQTPILLGDTVLTERDISDAAIKYDQRSAAYILIKLRHRHDLPSMVAFEVDSVMIATAALDTTHKLNRIELYPEMQYHDMKILRSYMMQPLGVLEISPVGGGPH